MTESANIHARTAEELLAKPAPDPDDWDPIDLTVFDTYRAIAHAILAIHSHLEQRQAWADLAAENAGPLTGELR